MDAPSIVRVQVAKRNVGSITPELGRTAASTNTVYTPADAKILDLLNRVRLVSVAARALEVEADAGRKGACNERLSPVR